MILPLELKNAHKGLETYDLPLEIKLLGDTGEIEGYGSIFGVVDSVNDIVAKGAFEMSLREHKAAGTSPKMLWQHDPGKPCGIWTDFSEDSKGLHLKGKLLKETTLGKEAHEFAKAGAVTGLSIGFRTKRYEYQTDSDIRVLTEVDLWEVSLVTFPALKVAGLTAVKSALTERRVEEILRDVGFSQKQAKAMVGAWKQTSAPHRDDGGQDQNIDLAARLQRLAASMK